VSGTVTVSVKITDMFIIFWNQLQNSFHQPHLYQSLLIHISMHFLAFSFSPSITLSLFQVLQAENASLPQITFGLPSQTT